MLRLEIVTPEKRILDAEVDSVTVMTASGEAGILPNHAPLISALKPGVLSYSNRGSVEKLAVAGGFVEVRENKVAVLADSAETADEIDVASARTDRAAAENELVPMANGPIEGSQSVRDRIDAANVRIQLAGEK
jgi:F-type H+-transporting ATPase subunit epsilon